MSLIPNYETLKGLMGKISEEFDLASRLKRYITSNADLISFANDLGLSNQDDAAKALFVADYVVTASEFPPGSTDEERRRAVIRYFNEGLLKRCSSSDALLKIYYFAYKTALQIRRSDVFLSGKGVQRQASLVILKEAYFPAYFTIAAELLGAGSCSWELSLLAAALKKTSPVVESQLFQNVPTFTDPEVFLPSLWKLLNDFSTVHLLKPNPPAASLGLHESSLIFGSVGGTGPNFSVWRFPSKESSFKDNRNALEYFCRKLAISDENRPLLYYRARLPKTQQTLMIVRDAFLEEKPMISIITSADEINVSEALSLLQLRGKEASKWMEMNAPNINKRKEERPAVIPAPQEKIFQSDPKDSFSEPSKSTAETATPRSLKKEKSGFFAWVFGKIRKQSQDTDIPTAPTKSTIPESDSQKVPPPQKLREHPPTRPIMVEAPQEPETPANLPGFLAESLVIQTVGGLSLFEAFDTLRESKYVTLGALLCDRKIRKTQFLTSKRVEDPKNLSEVILSINEAVRGFLRHFSGDERGFIPEELVFSQRDNSRFVICLDANEDRLVGTIGATFLKDVTDWRAKDVEIQQRRTLRMRTGQLLSSLRHGRFDDVVKRVYGESFEENTNLTTLDTDLFERESQ